jgi:tetratricopeptide (TPR) repeat protein
VLSSHHDALRWFTLEEANLRLVLEIAANGRQYERTWKLALCLDAFYFRRGNRVDRLNAFRVGLHAARSLDAEHAEAALLLRMGATLADLGRLDDAVWESTRAVRLAKGDPHLECAALDSLGYCLLAAGEFEKARERTSEALAIARDIGDVRAQATVLNNLANVLLGMDNAEEALRCIKEALWLLASVALSTAHVTALHTAGSALWYLGRTAEALQFEVDGLELAEQLGDQYQAAACHRAIGDALEQVGGIHFATPHWQSAVRLYRELRLADAEELATKLARPLPAVS